MCQNSDLPAPAAASPHLQEVVQVCLPHCLASCASQVGHHTCLHAKKAQLADYRRRCHFHLPGKQTLDFPAASASVSVACVSNARMPTLPHQHAHTPGSLPPAPAGAPSPRSGCRWPWTTGSCSWLAQQTGPPLPPGPLVQLPWQPAREHIGTATQHKPIVNLLERSSHHCEGTPSSSLQLHIYAVPQIILRMLCCVVCG